MFIMGARVHALCRQMLLRGLMRTRDDPETLHPKDLFLIFDNHVHHHTQQMLKCFIKENGDQLEHKELKKVYITMDEESLRSRKGLIRTGVTFDQIEMLTLVTSTDLHATLPMAARMHYPGTNLGNKIGDVILPDLDSLWKMACKQKLPLHGPFRVAVGGRTPGEEEDAPGRGTKRKTPDTIEPVFWHARPQKLYQELMSSYRLGAIIDLAAGDGTLAMICAKQRTPYLGFTLTDVHAEFLKHRCAAALLESAFVEGEDAILVLHPLPPLPYCSLPLTPR